MVSFLEGTLLISNALLILLCIGYGVVITKKKEKQDSTIWIYFLIACGLYFISELFGLFEALLFFEPGMIKAFLRIAFGVVVLLAFLTKYSEIKVP